MRLILSFLSFAVFVSCGFDEQDYSLKTNTRSAAVQKFLDNTIVVGTYGRAGSDGGIEQLTRILQSELVPLGVPAENVYWQSWNLDSDDAPGPLPSTGRHRRRINKLLSDRNSSSPSYIALFGHSFGGWASARLSKELDEKIGYVVDRLYLLDPVIVSNYRVNQSEYQTSSKLGESWYQTNAISTKEIDHCVPIKTCSITGDISCGQEFRSIKNTEVEYQRRADGSYIYTRCLGIPRRKVQVHTTVDDDGYLQQKILDAIVSDIKMKIAEIEKKDVERAKLEAERRNKNIAAIRTLFSEVVDRSPTIEEFAEYLIRLEKGENISSLRKELIEKKNRMVAVITIVSSLLL